MDTLAIFSLFMILLILGMLAYLIYLIVLFNEAAQQGCRVFSPWYRNCVSYN